MTTPVHVRVHHHRSVRPRVSPSTSLSTGVPLCLPGRLSACLSTCRLTGQLAVCYPAGEEGSGVLCRTVGLFVCLSTLSDWVVRLTGRVVGVRVSVSPAVCLSVLGGGIFVRTGLRLSVCAPRLSGGRQGRLPVTFVVLPVTHCGFDTSLPSCLPGFGWR